MKTKDRKSNVELYRESANVLVFRQACMNTVILGDALFRSQQVLTHVLRHADDMSVVEAMKIGAEAGIGPATMRSLCRIARSQAGEWCTWLAGQDSIADLIAMIDKREAQQLALEQVDKSFAGVK